MTLNAPLYQKVCAYGGIRFHMPAHNGLPLSPLYASAFADITELSFSDNLLFANGVIREAEELAAAAYRVKYSRFFTSGGTSAILTALCSIRENCRGALVLGACHASVFNGLRLFGIPFARSNRLDADSLSEVDAIITTSPDVYGKVQDIKAIRELIGERLLIVDEAHGAHYAFCSRLPQSAARYADIVMNSMHKTLPVYTGGAVLHTDSAMLDKAICSTRRMIHTTSPSYLVMASMDYARALFEKEGESLYGGVAESVARFTLPKDYSRIVSDDFSRVVIGTKGRGERVSAALEGGGIFPEMHDTDNVVLIVTPYNKEYLPKVQELLHDTAFQSADKALSAVAGSTHSVAAGSTHSAVAGKIPSVIADCNLIGRIAKRDIGLFPPCVPIILKGEVITAKKLGIVLASRDRAYGLDDEN